MSARIERDDLLPGNATPFERAQSETSARLLEAPSNTVRTARDAAQAPAVLLGHLAWEKSVHHPSDDAGVMRARIASSFDDHCAYGTPAALEAEIALDVGAPVTIEDFYEVPGAAWPDFFVNIPVGVDGATVADPAAVLASALRRKNVRDWPIVRWQARDALARGAGYAVSVRFKAHVRSGHVDPTLRDSARRAVAVTSHIHSRIRSTRP